MAASVRAVMSHDSSRIFSISAGIDQNVKVTTSTLHEGGKNKGAGSENSAFEISMTDLTSIGPAKSSIEENLQHLGLTIEGFDDSSQSTENDARCTEHRLALNMICTDCPAVVCGKCQRAHHARHKTATLKETNDSHMFPELLQTVSKCIYKREQYETLLATELHKLGTREQELLSEVDMAYDSLILRVNAKREEEKSRVKHLVATLQTPVEEKLLSNKSAISSAMQTVHLLQRSNDNDLTLSELAASCHSIAPRSLAVPCASVAIDFSAEQLSIPEVDFLTKTSSFPLAEMQEGKVKDIRFSLIRTIGRKGSGKLEFAFPGGICIDKENSVYVCDEGNNRIQRISRDGLSLGVFNWAGAGNIVTDVAYDAALDRLLVPRAYSDHGLLKCNTFSWVTVTGEEISRVTIPEMQGGLFVKCGDQGCVIVSDLVRKSLFVLLNDQVQMEIADSQYLKQPAHACFGQEGDILVVDSVRAVAAMFDRQGMHIRDIGKPGTGEYELRKPSGIAVDATCGIVIISDWCGDKIVLYTYSGEAITSIGGFKCPHSIAINSEHRIVVTDCWNAKIKVLSYSEA